MKYKAPTEIEFKGLIDVLINQTKQIFNLDAYKKLIQDALRKDYVEGIDAIDKEVRPEINFTLPQNAQRQLEGLYNYVEQNMQNAVDEIGNKLRQEVQRGLQNKEDKKQIIARVKRVFKDDKMVTNRLKTVIRTETNRANNSGRLEAMEQAALSGIKLKKWLDVVPYKKDISSPFCNTPAGSNAKNSAYGKYGNETKAIALDKNFIVKANNKTVRALAPPFHINCRTRLRSRRVK